jgi:hypothetical protein
VSAQKTDNLVLGTVNASWKTALSAKSLAEMLSHVQIEGSLPHIATFFTEVKPHLILDFAKEHHIPKKALFKSYQKVKSLTGEANGQFEVAFAKLGTAA